MLTCPHCGHVQKESVYVMSTYCRGCSEHLKIVDGKPVASRPAPPSPFPVDTPRSGSPAGPIRRPADIPAMPAPQASSRDTGLPEAREHRTPPQAPPQEIQCHNCGHLHHASPGATSTVCPRCGEEEFLQDLRISRTWNQPVRTRGNVLVTRDGAVGPVPIRCENLVIEGAHSGDVECRGDFVMRAGGRISGRVRCKRLIVEQGAEVEFARPVDATEVRIDGCVRGDISCPGRIILEEHARLHGDIRARALVVKTGARHTGLVKVPA